MNYLVNNIYRVLPSQRYLYNPIPKPIKIALFCIGISALASIIIRRRFSMLTIGGGALLVLNKDPILHLFKQYTLHRNIEEYGGGYEYINERWFQACREFDHYTLSHLDKSYHVNPNIYDQDNQTALMIAAQNNDLAFVRRLKEIPELAQNLRDHRGETAFFKAARLG